MKHIKYPRTPHLPKSASTSDDVHVSGYEIFAGKEVVVTLKMDGENTTFYGDGFHARAIDSPYHPSRDEMMSLWTRQLSYRIEDGVRICGENLYAIHRIEYTNLPSYFMAFSIWKEDICLSWNETTQLCKKLGLDTVPIIYEGEFDITKIERAFQQFNLFPKEGFVVRLASSFHFDDFGHSCAKWVSNQFLDIDTSHNDDWRRGKFSKNKLK